MGKSSKRVYTPEFKKKTARLAVEIGTKKAAEQLGVPLSVTAKWKKAEIEKDPELKASGQIDYESEYKKLLAENAEQKKVIRF